MRSAGPRRLCEILGMEEDPTLEVVGFSVEDNTVRIECRSSSGAHVRRYRADEARRVAADLAAWMERGDATGSDASAAAG